MNNETKSLNRLAEQLELLRRDPTVIEIAKEHLSDCRERGLISDWDVDDCPKPLDFASLTVAISQTIPKGGSVEVGVYRGGTAGLMLQCSSPDSFHVSIDPYGLPAQAYRNRTHGYGDWSPARQTLFELYRLAHEREVNFCHYLMGSAQFVDADLLSHPGGFRIVHLDGPHDFNTVFQELRYFRSRISGPCVFIMDDDNPQSPDVREALSVAGNGMVEIFHQVYEMRWGEFGFSAWLLR